MAGLGAADGGAFAVGRFGPGGGTGESVAPPAPHHRSGQQDRRDGQQRAPHRQDVGQSARRGRFQRRLVQREARAEPHLQADLSDQHRSADGEDVAGRAVEAVAGVADDHRGGQQCECGQQRLQPDHRRMRPDVLHHF